MSDEFKQGYRYMAYDKESYRLKLDGMFTAGDLRALADWLEDPSHPVISQEIPVMTIKLSPL